MKRGRPRSGLEVREDDGNDDSSSDSEDPYRGFDIDAVFEHLAIRRADFEEAYGDDRSTGTHWYVRVDGGPHAVRLFGHVVYQVGAYARAHTRAFREQYSAPEQKTFSIALYSEEGAHRLASEWALRCEHFFKRWQENGSPTGYNFLNPGDAFVESDEFLDWAIALPIEDDATWQAIHELRAYFPAPL